MSLTINLLLLFIVAILGLIIGILKKNRAILIISIITCVFLIALALFLIFILIPAM